MPAGQSGGRDEHSDGLTERLPPGVSCGPPSGCDIDGGAATALPKPSSLAKASDLVLLCLGEAAR